MGMKLADLQKIGKLEPTKTAGVFTLNTAPRSHPQFESYALVVSPTTGLCKITAFGIAITTSRYGEELQARFEALDKALQAKYGPRELLDSLRPGSTWNQPQYWMRGLDKKERALSSLWSTESQSTLTDNIDSIVLDAVALDDEHGFLTLTYEFTNFEGFRAGMNRQIDDAL
jgi:hypothetical protein